MAIVLLGMEIERLHKVIDILMDRINGKQKNTIEDVTTINILK